MSPDETVYLTDTERRILRVFMENGYDHTNAEISVSLMKLIHKLTK